MQKIFLYIYCFLPIFAIAQGSLQGKVIEAKTKNPIEGAMIEVIGTSSGAYTDSNGYYEISDLNSGDYTVRVTYAAFADREYTGIRINKEQTTTLNIEMTEATTGEVIIVGEKNLINLQSGKSETSMTAEQIAQTNVKDVQGIAALVVGVNQTNDGIQIRNARVYETQYVVEGINAQDPLAGTGFGVDVNAGAVASVDVTTGGPDAEYGGGAGGIVSTKIKEGGKKWAASGAYFRDNLGFNVNQGVSWNTDQANVSIGGSIKLSKNDENRLYIFVNGSALLADNYYRIMANQLHSSVFTNDSLWSPRQDNQWTNTVKLSYRLPLSATKKYPSGIKFSLTNQHSLNINQSNRTLQVVGNNAIMQPGLQFPFALQPDNANTYTHQSNLTAFSVQGLLSEFWTFNASVGRLFTALRTDANGRPFRSTTVDQIFDPASIVTNPISVFNPNDSVAYVNPGPGFFNNNGIASLWHDHYAQEYTIKSKFTYNTKNKVHYFSMGQEHVFQEYQWIDITRPWIGAPIQVNDTFTTPSTSLGSSSDFWKASPQNGGIFFQDDIRYKGIIAAIGLRMNYWAPGAFVDDAVKNDKAPVLDQTRQDYQKQTFGLMGLRWKARLLPRLRVSFPVTDNSVLYFNYSHAMRLPHPRFVYAGLDPVYQDRSFLANLGNPNLNPEVTVAYELGLKTQLSKDLALTATAFYNDKFDYIVSRKVIVKDPTGRFVEKTFFINQDYARIRGLEVSMTRRVNKVIWATLSGTYTQAKGKSNSAAESALQIQQTGNVTTTKEQYLAWDRPFDVKAMFLFKPDSTFKIKGHSYKWLNGWRAMLSATYKSGLRYTPMTQTGVGDNGRPIYEPIEDQPFSKIGSPWFWTDIRITKDFYFANKRYISLSARMDNVTNFKSAAIINPVTGRGYEVGDPLPNNLRDPNYPNPQDDGLPADNPARYLQPTHVLFGIEFNY